MSWKIGGKFYRRTDTKMTLWYMVTFLVSSLIICTFLYLGLKYRLLKEIDQFLLDETKEMEKVLSQEPQGDKFFDEIRGRSDGQEVLSLLFSNLGSEGGAALYFKEAFGKSDMNYGIGC